MDAPVLPVGLSFDRSTSERHRRVSQDCPRTPRVHGRWRRQDVVYPTSSLTADVVCSLRRGTHRLEVRYAPQFCMSASERPSTTAKLSPIAATDPSGPLRTASRGLAHTHDTALVNSASNQSSSIRRATHHFEHTPQVESNTTRLKTQYRNRILTTNSRIQLIKNVVDCEHAQHRVHVLVYRYPN